MLTSARNQFAGKVAAIHPGVVNDEIDIALPGGDMITAVITQRSTANLGLTVGGEALAIIKAPWVVLANPEAGIKLSTRNPGCRRCVRARSIPRLKSASTAETPWWPWSPRRARMVWIWPSARRSSPSSRPRT